MGLKAKLLRHVLAAWLCTASLGSAPTRATAPALTFFSSLTEQPFARLEAETVSPRRQRHGPFRVPTPGLSVESPALALFDESCSAEDWTRFLRELSAWRSLPAEAEPFAITLPDGRVFAFAQGPKLSALGLTGILRPLDADPADTAPPLLLRIRHDGDRVLRIDLRPRLAPSAAPRAPAPEERSSQT